MGMMNNKASRGGDRPGAGRPVGSIKPNNKQSLTIRLPPDVIAALKTRGKAADQIERGLRMLWASESSNP